MYLSLSRFQLLCPRAQLLHTLIDGTYLAACWQQNRMSKLYYLPDQYRGFFIEVGQEEVQDSFVVLRSFLDSLHLEKYFVSLAELY